MYELQKKSEIEITHHRGFGGLKVTHPPAYEPIESDLIALVNHQGLKVSKGIQLQSPSPPIGLAYLGAYLKMHNITYTAIDACGKDLDRVKAYKGNRDILIQGISAEEAIDAVPPSVKVIGFTCLFSHAWPLVLELADIARGRFPQAILVIGGEHCTALPEDSLKKSCFDVAVLGEGEETFLELVRKINTDDEWRSVSGIAYIDTTERFIKTAPRKRVTEVDSFPIPDWDSWHIEQYIKNNQVTGINLGRTIPILGSRGCPYNCKFCSNEEMWTTRYIMRNPKKLVDEMEYLKDKYNLSGFSFMDLTFIVNRKKTKEFAKELIRRKLDINYQLPAGTRCEAFDNELPELLCQSGLKNFAFAPESGDPNILRIIRKRINIDVFLGAVKASLKTDMTIGCFFVIGFPEDTKYTMKQSLSLVRKLAWMGVHDVTVSQFTPYPGSDYFRELLEQHQISTDETDLGRVIDFYSSNQKSYSNDLSSKSIYLWMLYMYLNFYVISFSRQPYRVIRNFFDLFAHGVENTRYIRLFGELAFNRRRWNIRVQKSVRGE